MVISEHRVNMEDVTENVLGAMPMVSASVTRTVMRNHCGLVSRNGRTIQ